MKYKGFEGTIKELVCQKIKEIEQQEHVKVLYAVESGSRAWGFASPDSDYDVRFVYVRPLEEYLRLERKKDFIDWELDEVLDINGWDLSKALQHLHKSNAMLFEWMGSPAVYYEALAWEQVRQAAKTYFSCKSAMCHYYGTAKKNYLEYFTGDLVSYKKYFYVLRPILACKWIEKKGCPPPVLFRELAGEVLEEPMRPTLEELLKAKIQMAELEKGQRIKRLDAYIAGHLEHFKEKTDRLADDRKGDWEELDQVFLSVVKKTAIDE